MPDFTETYDEQLWRVYGFIAYRVSNRADAEDLTQQTFERALRHWSEFDGARASMTTWLLTIARNLVIDHYRLTTRGRAQVTIEDVPEAALPSHHDSDAALGPSPRLGEALAALGDRERELIGLRFGADLSGREIAAVTGLTLGNVQQILSRSLRRLRELMGEQGGASLGGDSGDDPADDPPAGPPATAPASSSLPEHE